MRGGSYWNTANRARSAYRIENNPRIEIRNQGFRVLLSSAPNPRRELQRGSRPEQAHPRPWTEST